MFACQHAIMQGRLHLHTPPLLHAACWGPTCNLFPFLFFCVNFSLSSRMNGSRLVDRSLLLINPADASIPPCVHVLQQPSHCFMLCLQLMKSCFCTLAHPRAPTWMSPFPCNVSSLDTLQLLSNMTIFQLLPHMHSLCTQPTPTWTPMLPQTAFSSHIGYK